MTKEIVSWRECPLLERKALNRQNQVERVCLMLLF